MVLFFQKSSYICGSTQGHQPQILQDYGQIAHKGHDGQRAEYFRSGLDDNEREEIARANFDYGKEEGLEEGLAEGEANKAKEVARKMLEEGIDVALIEKITGLSSQEVKKLLNYL